MYEDFMRPYVHLVEELLRRKTYVMIYNGQNDLIVESPGTFKWAEQVHYDQADKFRYHLNITQGHSVLHLEGQWQGCRLPQVGGAA